MSASCSSALVAVVAWNARTPIVLLRLAAREFVTSERLTAAAQAHRLVCCIGRKRAAALIAIHP